MSDTARPTAHGGSPSLDAPDLWWYEARGRLLRTAFDPQVAGRIHPDAVVLDVGSADGPSHYWRDRGCRVVSVDPDARGLADGGVCAALPDLPFPSRCFDIVTAFDVIEHCPDDLAALQEVVRVLRPGGMLLMTVPAYQWAWGDFDVLNGHYRRYTRRRAVRVLRRAGLEPLRATYAFASVFPAFAAQRMASRFVERLRSERATGAADVAPSTPIPRTLARAFLGLSRLDERWLARHDLAFGSSVFVAATSSSAPSPTPRRARSMANES